MQRIAVIVLAGLLLAHLAHPGEEGVAGPPLIVVTTPAPQVVVAPPPVVATPVQAAPPTPVPPPPRPRLVVDDREGLGPCPATYGKATDVPIAAPPAAALRGATASAYDVRLIAAWNDDAVVLSVDEGRSWRTVLAHDGDVADALFDCHGRLHVLRAGDDLGTYDDALAEPERWTHLDGISSAGDDHGRLVADGGGVAVIGNDVAAADRLVLVRRDARGRWRSAPLAHDDSYAPWDGISVIAIEPAGPGRVRLLAMPWEGGECGYARYDEITFDLALRRVKIVQAGEEMPARWQPPELDGLSIAARDRAGRWIAIADEPAAAGPLLRMRPAELAAHLAPAD